MAQTPKARPGAMQAHLGRAAKFADGSPRNRAFYLFFRKIRPQEKLARIAMFRQLLSAGGGVPEGAAPEADVAADDFRHWLGVMSGAASEGGAAIDLFARHIASLGRSAAPADRDGSGATAARLAEIIGGAGGGDLRSAVAGALGSMADVLDLVAHPQALLAGPDGSGPILQRPEALGLILQTIGANPAIAPDPRARLGLAIALMLSVITALLHPGRPQGPLAAFGKTPAKAGLTALRGGLPLVLLYEILREAAASQASGAAAVIRDECGEDRERAERRAAAQTGRQDGSSVNVAFTHGGLAAMGLDPVTLRSFPDVFREGMAERFEFLGDTGPGAPEHWDGALGTAAVHGYLNFGLQLEAPSEPVPEHLLAALRRDVAAFNAEADARGQWLRAVVNGLYGLLGMEILHIEFGEDPYEVVDDVSGMKVARPTDYRLEHFGFRDGISQPFVDLGLDTPAPGGGTPARGGTWDPVAPGEIYLDRIDEDGQAHLQPVNPDLRSGATYVVFRKLEQDVQGFRAYLRRQKPDDPSAQKKLAAEFVGRWPDGVSLVHSPDADLKLGEDRDARLNDFLYVADDADGRRCPLGSHVRRSNPRDIGQPGVVPRHRILRRGISYGGPLLAEDSREDGTARGLLFVAANARIDTQFEVVQADWINTGEFLGQAGLGRCPLTGANDGTVHDTFLEADGTAPVIGIPRFVITRGGDYFFAPGAEALRQMAAGETFPPDETRIGVAHLTPGMGDLETPDLFAEDRLKSIAQRIVGRQARAVRVDLPRAAETLGGTETYTTREPEHMKCTVVFLARYGDVKRALTTPADSSGMLEFSVEQYTQAARRLSRGHTIPVATEYGNAADDTSADRDRYFRILDAAWQRLFDATPGAVDEVADRCIEKALRRARPEGRIDLVHDLAAKAAYGVVAEVFGVPGPDWLTELAVALKFSKQHVGELHPEWLATIAGAAPEDAGMASMQLWSILLNLDIVANFHQNAGLKVLALQAASEFLTRIDLVLAEAATRRPAGPRHLVDHLVDLAPQLIAQIAAEQPDYGQDDYFADVRMILFETCSAATAIVPMAFGTVMDFVLEQAIDLRLLEMPDRPDDIGIAGRLIYEATRMSPVSPMQMRRAARDVELCDHEGNVEARIEKGQWVASLIQAASFDPKQFGGAFDEPMSFSLDPYLPGPERKIEDYLLFGVHGGNRQCWGRYRVAMPVLERCLRAAQSLGRLRRMAGPKGKPRTFLRITTGLLARFPRQMGN